MQPEERDAAYLWDMLQASKEAQSMLEDHDFPHFLLIVSCSLLSNAALK